MLSKVISGGQIGADIAGLRAARSLGIETGGWAPKDWLTLHGPNKAIMEMYGLVECEAVGFAARTERNVRDSDCTIRLAINFNSPGERCTMKNIAKYNKAFYNVAIIENEEFLTPTQTVAKWIINNKFECVNIAGNAKQFLESPIESYLRDVFLRVQESRDAGVPDE